MTSEEKVKQIWPKAFVEKEHKGRGALFRVTIKPGRYTYGRMRKWAWKAAWDSIVQDDELCHGAPGAERKGEGA